MTRLTKLEIERRLLEGGTLSWREASGKSEKFVLADSKARRLFAFLLSSRIREPTGLPQAFIAGLADAYDSTDDPAQKAVADTATASGGPWRLHSIRTEGFGGLNTWGGAPFELELDDESLILEGPNGSGKSSLAGAIIWALTGERPRDQHDGLPHVKQPVYSELTGALLGEWPPLVCYPPKNDLGLDPTVRVRLTFKNESAATASLERYLQAGETVKVVDPPLSLPDALIEAGLLMPARLAQLRLADGPSRLTSAIETLTGLDDLIAIGALVVGLCHGSREYLTYRAKELTAAKKSFEGALENAATALKPVHVTIPSFKPEDTRDTAAALAIFGKELREKAAGFAEMVSNDLETGLDLKVPANQTRVAQSLHEAEKVVRAGLEDLSCWKALASITAAFTPAVYEAIDRAIAQAHLAGGEAISLLERSATDSRFRLKAVAARWHADHGTGPIDHCPLCLGDLKPSLVEELESLRAAGDAAARTFDDNVLAIAASLDAVLPAALKQIAPTRLHEEPRETLINEIRSRFVASESYATCLVTFGRIVETALEAAPGGILAVQSATPLDPRLRQITDRIETLERAMARALWFETHCSLWEKWWEELADGESVTGDGATPEGAEDTTKRREALLAHIKRLAEAFGKAEPYRTAAEALGRAWRAGKEADEYQTELNKRNEIAKSLAPLKSLGGLCQSVARQAIDELSSRAGALLEDFLLVERLNFKSAQLQKKAGLVVHAGLFDEIRIDATLIANTSWLRAVLWCFIFALREEAVARLGYDAFPFMVFDDPQNTFDAYHRARWATYVASLQNAPTRVQIVLTTYEEHFLDLITFEGVGGRKAHIAAPGPNLDHAAVLEGGSLERAWIKAKVENTPAAAQAYLRLGRIHVEGLLKLMLRGEGADVRNKLLGSLRTLLTELNNADKAPWKAPIFKALLTHMPGARKEIKYLEGSAHTTGQSFGMAEATDVERYLRKDLIPALNKAYDTAKEHRLLHGGMKALHAAPPTAILPEGYKTKVSGIPLTLLGRAAARTDGRDADGLIDMSELQSHERLAVTLNNHAAYRLAARTLEPVARRGDILLTKDVGEPSNRSLVVALSDDRVLARRFEISANQDDIAVLVAQAINPRDIAPPIVALKSTYSLHKIVGVIFDHGRPIIDGSLEGEVHDCGGEASIQALTAGALGLVEVVGKSAEPIALDKQYLIVKSPVSPEAGCRALDDQPIIAEDSDGSCYFKRLRVVASDWVVLESLESSGDFPPKTLRLGVGAGPALAKVWPVAGILFELPT